MSEKQQSNLVVLTFEGQQAAEALYEQIEQMEKDKLVVIDDAVIVEREMTLSGGGSAPDASRMERTVTPMAGKPLDDGVRVKQTRGKKGKYAAIGGGAGLLAAAILGGPIGLAAVAGAGLGAITSALKDFGINDATIATIKQNLQPGTSALLLLGRANDRDALLAKLRTFDARVVMTSLDPEVERQMVARLQG
jgi:uncharacterized membrane protein